MMMMHLVDRIPVSWNWPFVYYFCLPYILHPLISFNVKEPL